MNLANSADFDSHLLERWERGDETALTTLVERYLKPVFAFCQCLSVSTREVAFELTVAAFSDAQWKNPRSGISFFTRLLKSVIGRCEHVRSLTVSPEEAGGVMTALASLAFEDRLHVLLRDQLNLRYEDIAALLDETPNAARSQTAKARSRFKARIDGLPRQEILR